MTRRRALRFRSALALPLALALWTGCSGPVAGELTVSLATPNPGDDGAVVVTVTAAASKEITGASAACTGCRVFAELVSPTELRAVVTGNLAAGPLVRLAVSDTRSPSGYTAQVVQVASRSFALRALQGYQLTVGQ